MESHTLEQFERLGYDAVIHALNVVSDLYGCVIAICRISSNLFMNMTRYTGVSLCYQELMSGEAAKERVTRAWSRVP